VRVPFSFFILPFSSFLGLRLGKQERQSQVESVCQVMQKLHVWPTCGKLVSIPMTHCEGLEVQDVYIPRGLAGSIS
jgi:hypothetical protein